MKSNAIIAIIVSLVVLGAAFIVLTSDLFIDSNTTDNNKEPEDETPEALGNKTSFNDAVNAFAFDLFRKISNDPVNEGNIFYSPYSVFTALAMTYDGARNNTADEMKNVLNIEQDNDSFHQYMESLYNYLNENSDYNISTANALWVRENFELLEEYIDTIETYYGGRSSEVDFSKPEEAAEIINQWVENQTNNLIKNLVPSDVIDPVLTMLILTNAIYFKGTWQIKFDEANTTDKDFTDYEGNLIKVPTMRLTGTENEFNYTETDDLQILELPYTGNEISMTILLPKEDAELSDVINSIDKDKISEWIDSMYETEIDIYLPKFKFETSYGLNDYLIELGMQDAFSSFADFSGIDGRPDLFISDVLHKAFINVSEEGTEAAAATAVVINLKSIDGGGSSRLTFNADHPFLFLIQHKETGTILSLGSIGNPLA